MKWLELCIDTARDGLDKLEAMLSALGIDGIEIEDEADFQSFLAGNRKYWDYVDEDLLAQKKGKCRIKCYLEDNEEAAAQLARVRLIAEPNRVLRDGRVQHSVPPHETKGLSLCLIFWHEEVHAPRGDRRSSG